MDLISRQNLMEQLHELCDKQCPHNEPTKAIGACCAFCFIDDVIKMVQQLPSAEPERKMGKWIPVDVGDCCYRCSECGFIRDAYLLDVGCYCPQCGLPMKGEQQ